MQGGHSSDQMSNSASSHSIQNKGDVIDEAGGIPGKHTCLCSFRTYCRSWLRVCAPDSQPNPGLCQVKAAQLNLGSHGRGLNAVPPF